MLCKVIEIGRSKGYVQYVFPLVLRMRRCIDSFGFLTRDCSYPYKEIFNGQVVIS